MTNSNNKIRILLSILLIGCLSMLFAEVFFGSVQMWFTKIWGVFVTLPLYILHILFFLWIAFKFKKTSLTQLYFLGALFALYESWITKVLWIGYIDLGEPIAGTFVGLGIAEYPLLVFFLHPIMSFIIPILTFEILTGRILIGHETILKKSKSKTVFIITFLLLISTFIAFGNKFNLLSANLSVVGTILLCVIFYFLTKRSSITDFEFSKKTFTFISFLLLLLYVVGYFILAPERIPHTLAPYVSILISYLIFVLLFAKSKPINTELTLIQNDQYSPKDLLIFSIIITLFVSLACLLASFTATLFLFTYYGIMVLGIILFISTVHKTITK